MNRLRSELRLIGQHARVMLLGQLATMAFGVTDAIVAGRYSDEALATLAVATSIFISIYVSLMSVLQALMPIYSELHGAGKPRELGLAFRQSFYLAALLCIVGMLLMFSSPLLLAWFEVPEKLRPEAQAYLSILAWALAPSLLFRMFASLSQSIGAPRVVMWLQTTSLLLKVPLTVWLVFGAAGMPALGVVGCAWATLIVNSLTCVAAVYCLARQARYQPLAVFESWSKPDLPQLMSFMKLGVPAGLASMVEVTSYTLMGLLVARLGVLATAAHQIAASVAAVLFMMPLSLSIASSARVSYWFGAGDKALAHQLARQAQWLTVGVAVVASSIMLILAMPIARGYSSSPAVAQLGASLLVFVAFYHVADAWQTIGCFLLRSWRITVMPMLVYALSLWALGLGGGFVLAYQGMGEILAWQSPAAFWLMGATAMAIAGTAFTWRLWTLTSGESRAS